MPCILQKPLVEALWPISDPSYSKLQWPHFTVVSCHLSMCVCVCLGDHLSPSSKIEYTVMYSSMKGDVIVPLVWIIKCYPLVGIDFSLKCDGEQPFAFALSSLFDPTGLTRPSVSDWLPNIKLLFMFLFKRAAMMTAQQLCLHCEKASCNLDTCDVR